MIHSLFCRHCLCQGLRRKRLIIKVHEKLNSCYLISSRTGLNLKKLTEISRDNLYWATACAILLKIGSALLKQLWITCPWKALNWATVMSVKRMEVFLWWKIFFCFWLRLHYVSSFFIIIFFLTILQMIFSQRTKPIFFLACTGISVFCISWGIWKQMLDIIMSKTRRKEKGNRTIATCSTA